MWIVKHCLKFVLNVHEYKYGCFFYLGAYYTLGVNTWIYIYIYISTYEYTDPHIQLAKLRAAVGFPRNAKVRWGHWGGGDEGIQNPARSLPEGFRIPSEPLWSHLSRRRRAYSNIMSKSRKRDAVSRETTPCRPRKWKIWAPISPNTQAIPPERCF